MALSIEGSSRRVSFSKLAVVYDASSTIVKLKKNLYGRERVHAWRQVDFRSRSRSIPAALCSVLYWGLSPNPDLLESVQILCSSQMHLMYKLGTL